MSKAIGAQWQADLAAAKTGATQTTCMCWKIERVTDGKVFYFTDADRVIPFDGNHYLTTTGFNRSALKTTGDLAAEGMSVVGIFDNSAIEKEDLVKGLFDGAKITIFLLDYEDIPKGPIDVGYGRFGAVTQTTGNTFKTEFRDLTQILNQQQGDVRTPLCRAELGDDLCNNASTLLPSGKRNPVPIDVPERQDSTAYSLGDVVKVKTRSDPLAFNSNIVNPSFETGDLTGWTVTDSGWTVSQSITQGPSPKSGSYMLEGTEPDPSTLEQVIDFRSLADFNEANADAGHCSVRLSMFRANADQVIKQAGAINLWAVDSALSPIGGTIYTTGFEDILPAGTWQERGGTFALPAGSRGVLLQLRAANEGLTNALFDDISLVIEDANQTANSSFAFEDRTYRCTVAGVSAATVPSMDTTIGNTTVDGTVTWTAEQSYTVTGEVRTSTGNSNFKIPPAFLTDPLYAAPWFNLGAVIWETGQNTGWLSEIKNASLPDIELKWPAPFPIRPGDKFRMQPGCNKTRARCKEFNQTPPTDGPRGNLDNMRAEPDLPGTHAFLQTPDAKA